MRATEQRDPGSAGLGQLDTSALVDRLLSAHSDVPARVTDAAPATADAVDATTERLAAGGRLAYLGGGTPGVLAAADAAELPPTFGIAADRIAVVQTGPVSNTGERYDEDSPEHGAAGVAAAGIGGGDVAVAIAASGSTPFTMGAATQAGERGALVVAVANVAGSPLAELAGVSVLLDTGPEPLMGSTRMRAALAQRLWLTVFSTAVMVRLGRTHDDLMVNVAPGLAKLRERRVTIAAEATGRERGAAAELLQAAGDDLRVAIVMDLAGVGAGVAHGALQDSGGRTRAAIAALRSQ